MGLRSFFDWFTTLDDGGDRRWVLLGKGPSFSHRHDVDLRGSYTFGLNHVCRELPLDVTHAIDLDVIDHCADALFRHAGVLVLPWRPHVPDERWLRRLRGAVTPSEVTLETLADSHPVLRHFAASDRLLWYNASSSDRPAPDSPVVTVRYFSAVAALNLLALAGVREVRSLGIDGGTAYSEAFADLDDRTRLKGPHRSFDPQFTAMAATLLRTGISYAPIDVPAPIRVYVGATPAQHLPVRVLEYSIRRHTAMDVEVTPLWRTGIPIPDARDAKNRGRTPFSFQRFLIPAAAGYRGRAIYLDSDMLVFRSLRELWDQPFGDADLLAIRTPDRGATARFSVLLLNCDTLRWDVAALVADLDAGRVTYDQLLYEMSWGPRIADALDGAWNHLDRFVPGETALLHYTNSQRQPWLATDHPLGHLWMRALFDALDAGFITREEIDAAAAAGHVRPSLPVQVERRIEDPRRLPADVHRLDRWFVEPFRLRPWHERSRLSRLGLIARAAAGRSLRYGALSRARTWTRALTGGRG